MSGTFTNNQTNNNKYVRLFAIRSTHFRLINIRYDKQAIWNLLRTVFLKRFYTYETAWGTPPVPYRRDTTRRQRRDWLQNFIENRLANGYGRCIFRNPSWKSTFLFLFLLAAAIFAIIVNTIGPFNAVHVTLILPVSLTWTLRTIL
jgi:presenilin-like A22 family membrane protease